MRAMVAAAKGGGRYRFFWTWKALRLRPRVKVVSMFPAESVARVHAL